MSPTPHTGRRQLARNAKAERLSAEAKELLIRLVNFPGQRVRVRAELRHWLLPCQPYWGTDKEHTRIAEEAELAKLRVTNWSSEELCRLAGRTIERHWAATPRNMLDIYAHRSCTSATRLLIQWQIVRAAQRRDRGQGQVMATGLLFNDPTPWGTTRTAHQQLCDAVAGRLVGHQWHRPFADRLGAAIDALSEDAAVFARELVLEAGRTGEWPSALDERAITDLLAVAHTLTTVESDSGALRV